MLNIYLDQNMWIYLARAAKDQDQGKPFVDVLLLAREAVKRGIARFPLSAVHYMEVWNTRSGHRRQDISELMLELARPNDQPGPLTIAGASELLACEIDEALRRRYGKPARPRRIAPFGYGVDHATCHSGLGKFHASGGVQLTHDQQFMFDRVMETLVLSGPADDLPADGIGSQSYKRFSTNFVAGELKLTSFFNERGLNKRTRDELLAIRSLNDIKERLDNARLLAGLTVAETMSIETTEGRRAFIADVPTLNVDYELHRLRHDNPQMKRQMGDLDDLAALSVAVVYCNVVVTEKMWADLIRRTGLDQQYETVVLNDLRQLTPILVRGSV